MSGVRLNLTVTGSKFSFAAGTDLKILCVPALRMKYSSGDIDGSAWMVPKNENVTNVINNAHGMRFITSLNMKYYSVIIANGNYKSDFTCKRCI